MKKVKVIKKKNQEIEGPEKNVQHETDEQYQNPLMKNILDAIEALRWN